MLASNDGGGGNPLLAAIQRKLAGPPDGGMQFNPGVALDPSQVIDRRNEHMPSMPMPQLTPNADNSPEHLPTIPPGMPTPMPGGGLPGGPVTGGPDDGGNIISQIVAMLMAGKGGM